MFLPLVLLPLSLLLLLFLHIFIFNWVHVRRWMFWKQNAQHQYNQHQQHKYLIESRKSSTTTNIIIRGMHAFVFVFVWVCVFPYGIAIDQKCTIHKSSCGCTWTWFYRRPWTNSNKTTHIQNAQIHGNSIAWTNLPALHCFGTKF